MTATSIFDRILLTEASYADLTGFDINTRPELLSDAFVSVSNGFGRTQADEFARHWRVVSHLPNTDTGFSATVFESLNNPGELIFAIRGTEPGLDDLVITDFSDIVLDGIAIGQVVDMYNYWQRLVATENESYQVARLVELPELTAQLIQAFRQGQSVGEAFLETLGQQPGVIVNLPNLTVQAITFTPSDKSDGLELVPASLSGIDVVGHSLGGHLAMAFTRLLPDVNSMAYTVNAAGFGPQFTVDNLLNTLAGEVTSFNDNRIINLYGTAGLNFVTQDVVFGLSQKGIRIPIFTENFIKGTLGFGATLGHGVGQVTDSAVVHDLLITLDDSLKALATLDAVNLLAPLFEAASNDRDLSIESLVNNLGTLLAPGFSPIQTKDEDSREVLFSTIRTIRQTIFVDPEISLPALKPKYQGLQFVDLTNSDAEGNQWGQSRLI